VTAVVHDACEPSKDQMAAECANALRLDSEEGEGSSAAPSEEQLLAWTKLREFALKGMQDTRIQLSHVTTGPTRAAYDHGKHSLPCMSWRLDHILFTSRSLQLKSRWSALEADEESAASGLPNRTCPSDHLPVAATFETCRPVTLTAKERDQLMGLIQEFDREQIDRWESLTEQLNQEQQKVEAAVKPSSTAEPAEQEAGKKKDKSKREKPPPEVIACIQKRREQERQCKAQMQFGRQQVLTMLGEAELDALELDLKFDLTTWAEQGAKQLTKK